MSRGKNILMIIGSASSQSSNLQIAETLQKLIVHEFSCKIFNDLKTLPHFDPELSIENTPTPIVEFRKSIEGAVGVIIITPEYVFSIPSGLKNAIEWCVSTTVFSGKPTGLITASASGQKGHEELQLIMKTVMAYFTEETCLLIQGVKAKFDLQGALADSKTYQKLVEFALAFRHLIW